MMAEADAKSTRPLDDVMIAMDVVDTLVLNNIARGGCTLMTSHLPRNLGTVSVRTLDLGAFL